MLKSEMYLHEISIEFAGLEVFFAVLDSFSLLGFLGLPDVFLLLLFFFSLSGIGSCQASSFESCCHPRYGLRGPQICKCRKELGRGDSSASWAWTGPAAD